MPKTPTGIIASALLVVLTSPPNVVWGTTKSHTVLVRAEGGYRARKAVRRADALAKNIQLVAARSARRHGKTVQRLLRQGGATLLLDLRIRSRRRRLSAWMQLTNAQGQRVARRVMRTRRKGGTARIAQWVARILSKQLHSERGPVSEGGLTPRMARNATKAAGQTQSRTEAAVALAHDKKLVGTWKPEQAPREDDDETSAGQTVPGNPAPAGSVSPRAVPLPAMSSSSRDRWENIGFALFAFGLLLVGFVHSSWTNRHRRERSLRLMAKAQEEKLGTPQTLHPLIDASLCIGCGTCTAVCPDRSVLGLIDNRAQLVTPANCVGHGVCAVSCPAGAMKLVFGTDERPMELPRYSHDFESNVKGMYIAGELGGMGLIANAFDQAIEATNNIARELGDSPSDGDVADLLIVGAGPAGLAASLRAKELGLSYRTVDQESWGGAIRAYPRAKLVMTRPMRVPLYGPVKLRETTKEELVELFGQIVEKTGVKIEEKTRVEGIEKTGELFVAKTSRGQISARRVLLAMGQRGTPRKMGVPGEEEAHVAYAMIDPEPWAGKSVVVVGGGDVACEVALSLSEQPGTQVTMMYRGTSLSRPKAKNRQRIEEAQRAGLIRLVLGVGVKSASRTEIRFCIGDGPEQGIPADQIFACIGGVPPTKFLSAAGIAIQSLAGQAPGEVDAPADAHAPAEAPAPDSQPKWNPDDTIRELPEHQMAQAKQAA